MPKSATPPEEIRTVAMGLTPPKRVHIRTYHHKVHMPHHLNSGEAADKLTTKIHSGKLTNQGPSIRAKGIMRPQYLPHTAIALPAHLFSFQVESHTNFRTLQNLAIPSAIPIPRLATVRSLRQCTSHMGPKIGCQAKNSTHNRIHFQFHANRVVTAMTCTIAQILGVAVWVETG